MKKAPLSPEQYVIFSMARALLIMEEWEKAKLAPIEFERLMLFDFVIQYPREVSFLIPELKITLESEGLTEGDLSDLFAKRSFENIYERFNVVVSSLTARALIKQKFPTPEDGNLYVSLTELGKSKTFEFQSVLSFSVREIATVLIENWSRRSANALLSEIFAILPDQSLAVQKLAEPFEVWPNE